MSKSARRKSKVPKITEAEYTAYLERLKAEQALPNEQVQQDVQPPPQEARQN